jgi:hypothetical protein
MFKVSITKQGNLTHQARFPTEAEALAWLAREEANGSFGKPERWEVLEEEPQEYLSSSTLEYMGSETTQYLLPAEYEVSIEDVSAQVEAEEQLKAKIQDGQKARQACQTVLDYIAGANLSKALTIEQITQMQTTLAQPEAALRAGRPTLAKQLIAAIVPDGTIVTEDEKQDCLNLLSGY